MVCQRDQNVIGFIRYHATHKMDRRRGRHKEERNQTYTIQYDKEKESVTLDLDEETEGWVSIGNFYLPQGEVIITLTDKVSGDYVIADAVKFTATEE